MKPLFSRYLKSGSKGPVSLGVVNKLESNVDPSLMPEEKSQVANGSRAAQDSPYTAISMYLSGKHPRPGRNHLQKSKAIVPKAHTG